MGVGGSKKKKSRRELAASLYTAAASGDVALVRSLLDMGADVNERYHDVNDFTVFHAAAKSGGAIVIDMLLESADGRNVVDLQDARGFTPLMEAAAGGEASCVTLLLERGADVMTPTREGRTVLHIACESGQDELATELIAAGADVCCADFDGNTPLHDAAAHGGSGIVKELCSRGAYPDATNTDGLTALHYAANAGQHLSVKALIDHGANPTCLDGMRRTPLTLAVSGVACGGGSGCSHKPTHPASCSSGCQSAADIIRACTESTPSEAGAIRHISSSSAGMAAAAARATNRAATHVRQTSNHVSGSESEGVKRANTTTVGGRHGKRDDNNSAVGGGWGSDDATDDECGGVSGSVSGSAHSDSRDMLALDRKDTHIGKRASHTVDTRRATHVGPTYTSVGDDESGAVGGEGGRRRGGRGSSATGNSSGVGYLSKGQDDVATDDEITDEGSETPPSESNKHASKHASKHADDGADSDATDASESTVEPDDGDAHSSPRLIPHPARRRGVGHPATLDSDATNLGTPDPHDSVVFDSVDTIEHPPLLLNVVHDDKTASDSGDSAPPPTPVRRGMGRSAVKHAEPVDLSRREFADSDDEDDDGGDSTGRGSDGNTMRDRATTHMSLAEVEPCRARSETVLSSQSLVT